MKTVLLVVDDEVVVPGVAGKGRGHRRTDEVLPIEPLVHTIPVGPNVGMKSAVPVVAHDKITTCQQGIKAKAKQQKVLDAIEHRLDADAVLFIANEG